MDIPDTHCGNADSLLGQQCLGDMLNIKDITEVVEKNNKIICNGQDVAFLSYSNWQPIFFNLNYQKFSIKADIDFIRFLSKVDKAVESSLRCSGDIDLWQYTLVTAHNFVNINLSNALFYDVDRKPIADLVAFTKRVAEPNKVCCRLIFQLSRVYIYSKYICYKINIKQIQIKVRAKEPEISTVCLFTEE